MPSLNERAKPDLVDLLTGEHACILSLLRHYERRLAGMGLRELKLSGGVLEAVLMSHAREEDQLLFGALPEAPGGVQKTLNAMYEEHQEQRRMIGELSQAKDAACARALLSRLIESASEHFAVEERVLFSLARQALGDRRLRQLGEHYARRRGISLADWPAGGTEE